MVPSLASHVTQTLDLRPPSPQVFLVTYPPQDSISLRVDAASAAAPAPAPTAFGLAPAQFMDLFPFHILLDKQCMVLQVCVHGNSRCRSGG